MGLVYSFRAVLGLSELMASIARSIQVISKTATVLCLALSVLAASPVALQDIEEVHAFEWPQENPSGDLVEASDGNFYGVTNDGGPGGEGTIFRVTPSGSLTMVVVFDGFNGGRPEAELVEGDDGHLYGVAGGIFRLSMGGELGTITLKGATNYFNPAAGLIKGAGGSFYGTDLHGGSNRMGSVFQFATDGSVTTLGEFGGTNGAYPESTLVEGLDGSLYGTTTYGGENNLGTVFRVKPFTSIEALMSFSETNGYQPTSGLTMGADGRIYGLTERGGGYDNGTIFRIDVPGECGTVASFDHDVGAPRGRLVQATDGLLYGAADYAVFRFNSATNGIQPLTSIFSGPVYLVGSLMQASDGFLYGAGGQGIYRMDLSGNWTTMTTFPITTSGYRPHAGLVLNAADGHLYGSTYSSGGVFGQGTLFEFDPSSRSLNNIALSAHLGRPENTLLLAHDGSMFGAGSHEVFRLTQDKIVTNFASFLGIDSPRPKGRLEQDTDGNLYGVTGEGGDYDLGTVFKISPVGEITTLHSFNGVEGARPSAGLTFANDGFLYGTTERGGPAGEIGPGTIFKIGPSGNFTSLAYFSRTNGSLPEAELIQASDGNFYSTTSDGGLEGHGTVFRVTPSGSLTTLFSFSYTNGYSPEAPLIEVDQVLYGTTSGGGQFYRGVVFGVSLTGELKTLASFHGRNGKRPLAGLTLGPDGHLYGTTSKGGSLGGGNIYRLVLPTKPHLRVHAVGGGIQLTWSKTFAEFRLEAKTDLRLNRPWRLITEMRATNSETISVTVGSGPDNEFFRLVKP